MDLVEIRKKAKKTKKDRKAPGGKESGTKETKAKETRAKEALAGEAIVEEAGDDRKKSPTSPAESSALVQNSQKLVHDDPGDLKEVLMSQKRADREEEEEEQIQVLTFLLAEEEYALNIMDIKEIVRPKEPTEVPRTPDFVLGIISLRGMIIPIFDVRRRLGLASTDLNPKNRVIVVNLEEHFFGLLVDSVVQVMDIPLSNIEPPPEIVGGVEGEYFRGIGRVDDRLIILLNLQRILVVENEDISGGSQDLVDMQTDLPG